MKSHRQVILELATAHKIDSAEYYMIHKVCLFKKDINFSLYLFLCSHCILVFNTEAFFFVLILNSTPRIKKEIRLFFRGSPNYIGEVCKKYVESLPALKNTSEEQQMGAHEVPAHTLPVDPLSKYCLSIYLLCVGNCGVF